MAWFYAAEWPTFAPPLTKEIIPSPELPSFCAAENIGPDCETIVIGNISDARECLTRTNVKYRFVIGMATLSGTSATRRY
ncbi:hypothetical protein OSJ57_19965 [Sphingomonas sp. HH69]